MLREDEDGARPHDTVITLLRGKDLLKAPLFPTYQTYTGLGMHHLTGNDSDPRSAALPYAHALYRFEIPPAGTGEKRTSAPQLPPSVRLGKPS
jgi:hypothetical protein